MSIIWTILIGFIVGLLAKVLTPGRDPSGFFITALIGIAGSLLATYGGQALGLYHAGEPAGFLGSLIGAVMLLVIYHMVRGRTAVLAKSLFDVEWTGPGISDSSLKKSHPGVAFFAPALFIRDCDGGM